MRLYDGIRYFNFILPLYNIEAKALDIAVCENSSGFSRISLRSEVTVSEVSFDAYMKFYREQLNMSGALPIFNSFRISL